MQNRTPFLWERYKQTPVVGILRGLDIDLVRKIAATYLQAGFFTLEVTMNTKGATTMISTLCKEFPDLNVGAGTVCTLKDLDMAISAGARFIVTPILDEDVIKRTVAKNLPIFPGAFSPTEIYKAWSLGASAVKIFPATQLGPQFLKDVSGPLNEIKLLPTGGISKENVGSFFEAGAIGVGMGSSLFDKQLIKDNDFEGLKTHFLAIKAAIPKHPTP